MRNSNKARFVVLAFEQGYRVSEDGFVINRLGNKRRTCVSKGCSYPVFSIRGKDRTSVFVKVHQLAAFQEFGEAALADGVQVRHLDDDKTNSRLDNLTIGTPSQNFMDQPQHVRLARAKHAASFVRKLTQDQADCLRRDRRDGMTYNQLMKKYGIAKSTVSYVVNGKTY